MKRLIAANLVLFTLLGMTTVLATGSIADPLISRSYLEGAVMNSIRSDTEEVLGKAVDEAVVRLDKVFADKYGFKFAPGFRQVDLAAGETITLAAGSSYILTSGTASLTITNGTVINISTGNEASSGSQVAQYRRYFCTEETTAVITASTAVTGQVDGYYHTAGIIDTQPGTGLPFTDVPLNAWFFNAVRFVFESELFYGTSADTFSPSTSMTRAMFVTVLHRLDGLPAAQPGAGFSDVSNPAAYYYNAVIWANANKIVEGYSDGTFLPDRPVSREEMATIMYRYARFKNHDMTVSGNLYDSFPDRSDVSSYAVDPLRWAVSWRIINGSNGMLLPKNTATRAEVAQIILNYCERLLV